MFRGTTWQRPSFFLLNCFLPLLHPLHYVEGFHRCCEKAREKEGKRKQEWGKKLSSSTSSLIAISQNHIHIVRLWRKLPRRLSMHCLSLAGALHIVWGFLLIADLVLGWRMFAVDWPSLVVVAISSEVLITSPSLFSGDSPVCDFFRISSTDYSRLFSLQCASPTGGTGPTAPFNSMCNWSANWSASATCEHLVMSVIDQNVTTCPTVAFLSSLNYIAEQGSFILLLILWSEN